MSGVSESPAVRDYAARHNHDPAAPDRATHWLMSDGEPDAL